MHDLVGFKGGDQPVDHVRDTAAPLLLPSLQ